MSTLQSPVLPIFSQWLLEMIHVDARRPDPAGLQTFTSDDWATLTDAAIYYRLPFQAATYLQQTPQTWASVPEASRRRLKNAVLGILMHNLRRQAQLRQMLSACEAAAIPVMLVKGLWLAEAVYGDLKARDTGDIDLLIREEDVARFLGLAVDMGFTTPVVDTTIEQIVTATHELALSDRARNLSYDIHWALTHPVDEPPVDTDSFWQRGESLPLAGVNVMTPRLEDHLLYLCFHAALHHRFVYVGPRALLDLAVLLKRPPRPIDWDDLITRAKTLNWAGCAWLMLDLVRIHLGVAPPPAVLDALCPARADTSLSIHAAALESMFISQNISKALSSRMVALLSATTPRQQIGHLFSHLLATPAQLGAKFMAQPSLHRLPMLYVRHWQDLSTKYLPKMKGLALRNADETRELERARVIARWLEDSLPSKAPPDPPRN